MQYRRFGRLSWQVSDVGYGMWGVAGGPGGWVGSDARAGAKCLDHAVSLGCNFFDTAWIYGRGISEQMLGALVSRVTDRKIYVATKIAPKNREWPSKRGDLFHDVFPLDYLRENLRLSLDNLGVSKIDLVQFHVWEDDWAEESAWKDIVREWKEEGLVDGVGISVNRWEPWNCLKTLRTGIIDSVQVIYNVFDQNPEDNLFPLCKELDIAVIARVPFDEGSLTGTLHKDSKWPDGDWRNSYFVAENLNECLPRVERLKGLVSSESTLPEIALRFILSNEVIATVIPGMRELSHVDANFECSDHGRLDRELLQALRTHRWDRQPTWWSQ